MWRRVAVSLTLKPVGANSFAKIVQTINRRRMYWPIANEFAPTGHALDAIKERYAEPSVGANSFAKKGTGNADVSPEQSFANEFAPTDVAGRVSD
jgi:hypothetical protein